MSETLYTTVVLCFFFCGMTAFSLLINSILLRFVKTLGTKNQPGAVVRWSSETKPAIGGLSFFILFLISFWIYSIVFDPYQVFNSIPILGLLVACTLGFVMGLTDDAYNTRPILKFSVQMLCGVILVLTDSYIHLFDNDIVNQLLTVIWVVGIMNSINMLDNMDGITTSVSGFILIAALGYIALQGNWHDVDFILLLGVLASLVGFLFFNWNPSSMYMGDTGSQFLGVILAYIGIRYCWNAETLSGDRNIYVSMGALMSVFLLPLIDTTTVTINRLRKGQSPFVGGKDHTTHNLSYRGLSDRQVAGVYCVLAALSVCIYFLSISFTPSGNIIVPALCLVYFLIVFLVLFGITEFNQRNKMSRAAVNNAEETDKLAKRA